MIRLVMPSGSSATSFHNFVDRFLRRRLTKGIPIGHFCLGLKPHCDYNRVSASISTALRFSLEFLELNFPPERIPFGFNWNRFSACTTLVSLTLTGKIVLDVPPLESDSTHFPSMRRLSLIDVCYRDDNTMVNLFKGSPRLQDLNVKRSVRKEAENNLKSFRIKSETLIRLRYVTNVRVDQRCKLTIIAPNLEHIHIEDHLSKEIFVAKGMAFVEASIDPGVSSTVYVLKGVSSVRTLKLSGTTLEFLVRENKREVMGKVKGLVLPSFPNVVKLEIESCAWNVINLLLARMPLVEDIKFVEGIVRFGGRDWNPEPVPQCLSSSVKRINISESITAQGLLFLAYLLENGLALESVTITKGGGSDVTDDQILELRRASPACQVMILP